MNAGRLREKDPGKSREVFFQGIGDRFLDKTITDLYQATLKPLVKSCPQFIKRSFDTLIVPTAKALLKNDDAPWLEIGKVFCIVAAAHLVEEVFDSDSLNKDNSEDSSLSVREKRKGSLELKKTNQSFLRIKKIQKKEKNTQRNSKKGEDTNKSKNYSMVVKTGVVFFALGAICAVSFREFHAMNFFHFFHR